MSLDEHAIYERARRLANVAVWTIHLQNRRIDSDEPEDQDFVLRRFADIDFFVTAMWRLRRAAELASKVEAISANIKAALEEFDKATPQLRTIRNTAEHIDDYALDQGRDKSVSRKSLEVGGCNGSILSIYGCNLDRATVLHASDKLFKRIRDAEKSLTGGCGGQ